jgi:hypothetical protein
MCIDVEPDDRQVGGDGPQHWPAFEEMAARLETLRGRLSAASGSPVAFTWFLRMDSQVEEAWGSSTWVVERYGTLLGELEARGDELGVHAHPWRRNGAGWIVDYRPEWVRRSAERALDAFASALGRTCRAYRAGDRSLNGDILPTLAARGVEVDLTVEPDLPPHAMLPAGELTAGPLPDFRGAPRQPYRSSPGRFPRRDPAGGTQPLLIPIFGVPRPDRWSMALLLPAPPSMFSPRLLAEVARRRPAVLPFVLRTDPAHLGPWDHMAANLEHLARVGARFVTASAAADAVAPAR